MRFDRSSLLFVLVALTACTSSNEGRGDAEADATRDAPQEHPRSDGTPFCPSSPPSSGTPCALPASAVCSYGDPCNFDRYACAGGLWSEVVRDGSIPSTCPDDAPSTGSTCPSCGGSFRCTYDASCSDGLGTTTSICSGGHWLSGTSGCAADAAVDAEGGSE